MACLACGCLLVLLVELLLVVLVQSPFWILSRISNLLRIPKKPEKYIKGPTIKLTDKKEITSQNRNRPRPGHGFGAMGIRMRCPPQIGQRASSVLASNTRMAEAIGQGAEKLRQRCGTGKLGLRMDQDMVKGFLLAKGCMGIFRGFHQYLRFVCIF